METMHLGAHYNNINIPFMIEGKHFYINNFSYDDIRVPIPEHSHGNDTYEIHYIPNGQGTLTIGSTHYELRPGTLFVTGPFIRHSQISHQSDPMVEFCVYLKSRKNKPKPLVEVTSDFTAFLSHFSCCFFPCMEHAAPLFQSILHELEHKNFGYITQIQASIQQLFVLLMRTSSPPERILHHAQQEHAVLYTGYQYQMIETYFLNHYNTLTLIGLSDLLGISPRQTQRMIKQHYQKTFRDILTETRMSAATIYLRDNFLSINEISELCGYCSADYFSAAFKKFYGISASVWRKNH